MRKEHLSTKEFEVLNYPLDNKYTTSALDEWNLVVGLEAVEEDGSKEAAAARGRQTALLAKGRQEEILSKHRVWRELLPLAHYCRKPVAIRASLTPEEVIAVRSALSFKAPRACAQPPGCCLCCAQSKTVSDRVCFCFGPLRRLLVLPTGSTPGPWSALPLNAACRVWGVGGAREGLRARAR